MLAAPVGLNVLHISQSDAGGGSARSAVRIHTTLRQLGHGSRMLVGEKRGRDSDVRPLKRNLAWRAADRLCAAVTDPLDLQYVLYPSSFGVVLDPWFRAADVVQLYNTHGSYFSHSALPLLSRRRPVVWRLSDMWPFTGHVAYSYDCERWRTGCGSCPYLEEYPRLRRDTTALLWRWKERVYRRSRLTIVAPSRWIERLARESPLLGRFPIRRVPNGVELDRYRPLPKAEARRALGLDPMRPLVLFAAAERSRRKGGAVVAEAVAQLDGAVVDFAVAGPEPPGLARSVRALGVLEPERMALAYAAADLFLLPALAENLPNTAVEAMACGTPCVAFDVGGIPDAVRHLETGWLAPAGDAAALAEGICALLGDDELRGQLARTCRDVAEREFSDRLEASRFAELYEEVIAA